MKYSLEQGATQEAIIKQCKQENLPLPEAIANAPILSQGLELYYMAFLDLTSCRSQGAGGQGPIGWIQINEYCIVHEIEGEQKEDLLFFVQRMDGAYLEYEAEKLKKSSKVR